VTVPTVSPDPPEPQPIDATLDHPLSEAEAEARRAADVLKRATGAERHDVAIVLGSGWVPAIDALGEADSELSTTDLPGFLPPAVEGHAGRIRSLQVGDKRVLAFLGRTHLYEGRGVAAVVHGVRVAASAGCTTIILTNASGGLRKGMRPGDPVLISDHLNMTGRSPLVGPRFVDMSDVYSPRLRDKVRTIDPSITEGVYAMFAGPQYETPAEVRMAGIVGADLVGMSTALEAIAARAEGCEVLGLSLVTNLAAGLGDKLDHEEVLATGKAAANRMGELLTQLIPQL
jgi:purine-nucleoside phosphorylase